MGELFRITLAGNPVTKKNSQRMIRNGGRCIPLPSKAYMDYRVAALAQMPFIDTITQPVNVRCVYYMRTRRIVDLVNLLEATDDILRDGGIIADDNSRIVAGHDGSRVLQDKENPRVEIVITAIEPEKENAE